MTGATTRVRRVVAARARVSVDALEHLVGGLGTAVLAMLAVMALVIVLVLCLGGVGFVLLPGAVGAVRTVANRERGRLSRWGADIVEPDPLPDGLRAMVADRTVRRELAWAVVHATFGFLVGLLGLTLPLYAVQDASYPLWWWAMPRGSSGPGIALWPVWNLGDALVVGVLGLAFAVVALWFNAALARVQAWPGRGLLVPSDVDLSLRVVQLTATRAAALDAHAAELRRIERSLHDGTQNRLVAVNVLLGAARRALARDPAGADEILRRAQDATEQALAELRTVARSILPPVLEDRGLAGALAGLTSGSAVPCRVDVDVPGRCAASVEATAYFVVAEALTNVAKHSDAASATVSARRVGDRLLLSIEDDGKGGADEGSGSGLTGIRQRVEAYDGSLTVTSPPGGPTRMAVELPCGA